MKKLVSLMLVLALVLGIATSVNAVVETADIKVSLNKTTAKVGDEITVTVDWKETMESVDLELGFDKTKVEFVSSSISEDYIATDRIANGVVQISWFSMNGQGITNITYKFKVIAEGTAKFTTAEAVLADANVESPSDYKYGTATLTVAKETTGGNTNNTTTTDTPNKDNTTNTNTPSKDNTTNTNTPSKNNTTSTDTPNKNTPTDTPTDTSNKNNTTNTTKKPETIPQAGVNMIECAIVALVAIIAVSIVAVVVKSKRK